MTGTLVALSRKLLATDPARRGLLFEAFVLVALARFLLFLFPLRRARPMLVATGRRLGGKLSGAAASDVIWAISAVTKRFSGTCLANALATQTLLKEYGHSSKIRIGVARKAGHFTAHAWVEQGDDIVIGGPRSLIAEFTPFPEWDGFTI